MSDNWEVIDSKELRALRAKVAKLEEEYERLKRPYLVRDGLGKYICVVCGASPGCECK